MMRQVSIIGFGLIGSSIAHVIRDKKLAERIHAVDMSAEVGAIAKELGIADESFTDVAAGVAGSDLVVMSVPVGAYEMVTQAMAPALKEGAIVTDVGSVKGVSIRCIQPYLPEHAHFVPGHPIAGTEHSGPRAGFKELFVGRWCILTPTADTDVRAVEAVTKLWEECGSMIELMDPAHHDLVLAITSHLPHLIAYTIVGTATDLEDHTKAEVIKFSASGFRDFTRIAASDPVMWRDIFLNNREAVLEILQRFTEDLTAMQRAIRWGDGPFLEHVFTRTRNVRRQIIQAGQADYPPAKKPEPEQPAVPARSSTGRP